MRGSWARVQARKGLEWQVSHWGLAFLYRQRAPGEGLTGGVLLKADPPRDAWSSPTSHPLCLAVSFLFFRSCSMATFSRKPSLTTVHTLRAPWPFFGGGNGD